MPQIINENPGIGALLGQGLGQGLSAGLQQLAHLKTQQLLNRHQQKQSSQGLQALGFSPQEAQQISLLPHDLQGLVLKNYLQAGEVAGLDQALRGVQVNPELQSGSSGLEELLAMESAPRAQANIPQARVSQTLGLREPAILNKQTPTEKVFADLLAQQTAQPAPVAQRAVQIRKEVAPRELPREEAPRNRLAEILRSPRLTPEQRLKVASLQQQRDIAEKKLSAKEQEEVNKETKPVYDTIQKEYKAAKDNDKRLDRMEVLIKEGNLDDPRTASYFNTISKGIFGIGLDLTHLLTADSQEFEKLSSDFVKGAKDYFGTRLTDADLRAFLKTVPTLLQTDEGKIRVIRNLREFNEAAKIKKAASDKVLKANGGRRPRDYDQLVEQLTEKPLDALAARFKTGR